MRRSIVLGSVLVALGLSMEGCAAEDPPVASVAALGEPMDGFPSWEERVIHVWTNRARQDPAADLASCDASRCAERACYTARPPLAWSHALARAARFHSDNLARGGCGLQHDSPCTLVAGLGALYTPGTCNGAPSCACSGGGAACGSAGTGFGARISLFGASARAENIATGSDPVSTFYLWLHERDTNAACGWRVANGHRANILGDASTLGVGKTTAGNIWTQDFGTGSAPSGIAGGVHYPRTGASVEVRANWYRTGAPTAALVNVDGTCTPMTLERGTASNGTYLASVPGSSCARYYFQFTDGSGDTTYPSTGSFGIGCAEDWSATRPPACGCTPSCGARSCGDDGCGGSCGTCGAGRTCNASGACACSAGTTECGGSCVDTRTSALHCGACGNACGAGATCVASSCVSSCVPTCSGRSCGDDGCGGSCGSCASGRVCNAAGACVCAAARTDCGGSCIDTATNPSHCGGCGVACSSGQACVASACVCVPSCDGRTCGADGCGGTCGDCSAGRVCSTGRCACSGALTECGGGCVDLRTDESSCGACGVSCAAGETCLGSACVAGGLDAGCVPSCTDRDCGDDTCGGSCGDCGSDRSCSGGTCACLGELTSCGDACVDLRADDRHCGGCDTSCASDERCVAGACEGGEPRVDGGRLDAGVRDASAFDGGEPLDGSGVPGALHGTCVCSTARRAEGSWLLALLLLVPLARRSSRAAKAHVHER